MWCVVLHEVLELLDDLAHEDTEAYSNEGPDEEGPGLELGGEAPGHLRLSLAQLDNGEAEGVVVHREDHGCVEEVDALRFILADLAMKGNAVDSRLLASELTDAVNGFRTNRKQEVRSALFAVLLGARMPAVLIEAGFVTDKDDVKRMKKEKRRLATAKFLADGIDAFAKKMAQERQ